MQVLASPIRKIPTTTEPWGDHKNESKIISKPPSLALWFDVGPWNAFWWPAKHDPQPVMSGPINQLFLCVVYSAVSEKKSYGNW